MYIRSVDDVCAGCYLLGTLCGLPVPTDCAPCLHDIRVAVHIAPHGITVRVHGRARRLCAACPCLYPSSHAVDTLCTYCQLAVNLLLHHPTPGVDCVYPGWYRHGGNVYGVALRVVSEKFFTKTAGLF